MISIEKTQELNIDVFNFNGLYPGLYPKTVMNFMTADGARIKLDRIDLHDNTLERTQAILSIMPAERIEFHNSIIKNI